MNSLPGGGSLAGVVSCGSAIRPAEETERRPESCCICNGGFCRLLQEDQLLLEVLSVNKDEFGQHERIGDIVMYSVHVIGLPDGGD